MLTPTMESKFRTLAESGYGDDVLHDHAHAWVIFRISETHQVCVRQNGGIYDKVEVQRLK